LRKCILISFAVSFALGIEYRMEASNIYITEIVNNTDQHIYIRYNVTTNIGIVQPLWDATSSNRARIQYQYPIILKNGARVRVCNAYIPTVYKRDDFSNVISLSTGYNLNNIFNLIRLQGNIVEKISRKNNKGYLWGENLSYIDIDIVSVLDISLSKSLSYTLEINQISDEIYARQIKGEGNNNVVVLPNAFEIAFKENQFLPKSSQYSP